MKIEPTDLWIIETDNGIAYIDKTGKLWNGGERSLVSPAVFYSKKSAQKFRAKAKKLPQVNHARINRLWSVHEDE